MAYLYRHAHSLEDAEDLLLEVFLAALERPGFEQLGEKEQEAWLWCVARNKMTDLRRKQTRRQILPFDSVPEETYELEQEPPELLVLQQEESGRLRSGIQQLPALQQEILHLRFVLNLRSAEIAAVLNKSDGSVRIMLSRAIKFLRKIYENE